MDNEKLRKQAEELESIGKRLIWGVTIPVILFALGFFFMPFGLVLWLIAGLMFLSINSDTIIKYADSKKEGNEND